MVSIDQNKCIGCGLCVKDCFYGVIGLQEGKAHISAGCFECGHCVAVCPTKAVSIPNLPMEEVLEYNESCQMDPENLLHFMQFRRSVRQFKKEPIPRETLETILEAGRYTPTAGNRQDVSYIVVQDSMDEIKPILWNTLEKMVDSGRMGPYTPLLRIVCDRHNADPNEDRLFCHANAMVLVLTENPMNGGLAATSLELMAQSLGVGVLYSGFLMGAINGTPEVKERLGIKENQHLAAVMLMGLADVKYQRTAPRKKVNVSWK
ncbi:MAG: nitroreductase family protein [Anaerotignum sp.]|nr:nitroreductase family protein [Anaerotignum sp.]